MHRRKHPISHSPFLRVPIFSMQNLLNGLSVSTHMPPLLRGRGGGYRSLQPSLELLLLMMMMPMILSSTLNVIRIPLHLRPTTGVYGRSVRP